MKILVLGAGATGGYFGGRFAEAGADVTFLVRPARAQKLRNNGLRINSPRGDLHIPVAVATSDAVQPEYDVIILSCKAYDLADAMTAIAPAMGPQACVLPLLNGMRHLDALDLAFGADRVLGGLCQIAATLDPEGTVTHLNPIHALIFGPRSPGQQAVCDSLLSTVSQANADVRLSLQIVLEMWEKWVSIIGLAGSTCLMRAAVGDIVAAPGGEKTIHAILDETTAIATACGYHPRAEVIARFRALFTEPGSSFTASMLRDIEAKHRIEADHIVGDLLMRAETGSVNAPLLQLIYVHLKAYEARVAREQAMRRSSARADAESGATKS